MTTPRTRSLASIAAATAALCALGVTAAGPAHAAGSVTDAADAAPAHDALYLRAAHQGNLAEIAAGRDAERNAVSDCVKQVGEALIRDHSHLDQSVTALATAHDVPLPQAPTPEQQSELAALQDKAGTPAYDDAWLLVQEAAHEATLALIEEEIARGADPEVKAAAEAARPVVEMHLEMVQGGTCQPLLGPANIPAGHGSQAGAGPADPTGPLALTGGAVLTAVGATWLVTTRRTQPQRER